MKLLKESHAGYGIQSSKSSGPDPFNRVKNHGMYQDDSATDREPFDESDLFLRKVPDYSPWILDISIHLFVPV